MILQAVTLCTFVGGYNRLNGNVNISTLKMGEAYSSETSVSSTKLDGITTRETTTII
jgi:hypothetical protein